VQNLSSYIWLAVTILTAVLPMIRKALIAQRREKARRAMEKARGSRVITMIHRQETMALLGLPIARYITIEDSERILREIRSIPADVPIDMVVHTPGGIALAAEQIAMALKRHKAPVTVFVPHYAMSGGTLIALAADRVHMDPNAVLGPVDPQLGQHAGASYLKAVELKGVQNVSDETAMLADMAHKAKNQIHDFIFDLLQGQMAESRAKDLAELFTDGRWTHDYPLTVSFLAELGLPVTNEMPAEVYRLMDDYEQTPQTQRPSAYRVGQPVGERAADR
jgi:ClpP class serine protease